MEKETKLYEIGYLINPGIAEEKVADEVNSLRNIIEKSGGVITVEEKAKLIKIAYTIKKTRVGKFDTAYFGWIKFMAEPENVIQIKNDVEKAADVIRFLITIGNEEQPQAKVVKRTYSKKDEKAADKPEVSTEEVDKKIEELIGA